MNKCDKRVPLLLAVSEKETITCWICSTEIIEYFEGKYKGRRGKCTICGINFPLE